MLTYARSRILRGLGVLGLLAVLWPAPAAALLTEVDDDILASETGQALLVADKIAPNSLPCSSPDNDCHWTTSQNLTFYRVGLDAKLGMNLNIDKMRLGCGGINDSIAVGCDIDLDYVRFMGETGSFYGSQVSTDGYIQYGAGAAATSDFYITRPYVELAIKNDGSPTQREIVGIKIGGQSADGYLSFGSYNTSTGVSSGANMLSGYMNLYLSGWAQVNTGLGSGTGCIGRVIGHEAQCGTYSNTGNPYIDIPANGYNVPWFRTGGTRMSQVQVAGVPLCCLQGTSGLASLLNGANLNANLDAPLSALHGLALYNTPDFYISVQRQPINWPKYDKTGYTFKANTGWWMYAPMVSALNVFPPPIDMGCPGFLCTGLLAAFAYPGAAVHNIDLGQRPVANCYGSSLFC